MNTAIGEVLESNTSMLKAQVPRDAVAPAFGSWVKVTQADGLVIYGVVGMVEQGSIMPSRKATALGKTTEELVREMPQVMELLRTSFTAIIMAFKDGNGTLRQTLPPNPAAIHGFVEACDLEDIQLLGAPFDFLRTLVQSSDTSVPIDDLMVAMLRQICEAREEDAYSILVEAGRVLSRLFRDDHERLQAILRRVQ
ncbi:MAG: hypothetical protein AB8G77_06790 [Rhodothermales bacterium]